MNVETNQCAAEATSNSLEEAIANLRHMQKSGDLGYSAAFKELTMGFSKWKWSNLTIARFPNFCLEAAMKCWDTESQGAREVVNSCVV